MMQARGPLEILFGVEQGRPINRINQILLAFLLLIVTAVAFGADNLSVTAGSGVTIGADEVTRNAILEKEQVVKIGLGADGTHDGFARMGQQTKANSLAVTLPSDQDGVATTGSAVPGKAVFVAGTDGTNARAIKTDTGGNAQMNVLQINGVAPSMGNGASGTGVQRVTIANDSTGIIRLAAGSDTVGNIGLVPSTTGGLDQYVNLDLSAGASIKGSAGQVYGWYACNLATALRYVKFYNKASPATVGTDTPVKVFPIPAGQCANDNRPMGLAFSLGISVGATTGIANSNTGAPSTNEVVVNIDYK